MNTVFLFWVLFCRRSVRIARLIDESIFPDPISFATVTNSAVSLLEEDSDGSNTDPDQAFVKAVTEVVRNLLREEERKNAGVHVKTDVFEALQACVYKMGTVGGV